MALTPKHVEVDVQRTLRFINEQVRTHTSVENYEEYLKELKKELYGKQ